jgi:hypothetical protein
MVTAVTTPHWQGRRPCMVKNAVDSKYDIEPEDKFEEIDFELHSTK